MGVARIGLPHADSLAATWSALRQHQLAVQVAGPAPASALEALLTEWNSYLADKVKPGDDDAAAVVAWPSHDTVPVLPLTRHGFAPLVVVAARPAGRATPPILGTGIRIRHGSIADLDVITDLHLVEVDYDARFGMVTRRPSTRAALRESMARTLERDRPSVWLAERAGAPIGLLTVDLPPHADWLASQVALSPVGYLECLVVLPEARGGGVGRALVAEGHKALDESGAAVTLLHHSLPNPKSTPFWYSHGYRPLWTYWQRRPVFR
jgi:GNAT superfamily N-acetyltransferase